MSDNDKVLEITSKFISELSAQKPSNLMMAVKTHYDLWQSELIVLLRQRNIGVNEYLAMLLRECGYDNATADKVRSYMSKIGKSKGSTSKTSPVPSLGITSPVVMTKGVVPPSSAVGVKGQGGSSGSVVVSEPMAVQRVAVAVPPASGVVYDLDEFPFKEHSTRLNTEVNAFYAGQGGEWTPADDELMAVFTQISLSRFTPMQRLAQSFSPNETIKQGCFNAFKIKCKNLGVDLSKHGFQ